MTTRGSVAFPAQANADAVMVLATNLIRIADLLDSNAHRYERAVANTTGRADGWRGNSAQAFERAMRRRTEQSRRAAAAARAVGQVLIRHGQAVEQSVQHYEANARAERYLRDRSQTSGPAIDGTIVGQAQAVGSLASSASSAVPVVREAVGQVLQLVNEAAAEAANEANPGGAAPPPLASRVGVRDALAEIDAGRLRPDPNSRLGAYAATAGYPPGTVGDAVHSAIGTIYLALGTVGEEQIGIVFNSPEARALYGQPLTPETSRRIAELEYAYWSRVRAENPWSIGGNLGSAFPVSVRDLLQRYPFSSSRREVVVPAPAPR